MSGVNKVESGKRAFGAQDSMCKGPVAGESMQRLASAREGTWLEQRLQRKADPEGIKRAGVGRTLGALLWEPGRI